MNLKKIIKDTDPMYKYNPLYKQLKKREEQINITKVPAKNYNVFNIRGENIILKLIEKDGNILLEDAQGMNFQNFKKLANYIYYFNNKPKFSKNNQIFLQNILEKLSRQFGLTSKKIKKRNLMEKIIKKEDIDKLQNEQNILAFVKDRVFLVSFKNKNFLNKIDQKQLQNDLNSLIPLIGFPLKKGYKTNAEIYLNELKNFLKKYNGISSLDYLILTNKNEITLVNLYHASGGETPPSSSVLNKYRHITLKIKKEDNIKNFYELYKKYLFDIQQQLKPKQKEIQNPLFM